MNAPQTGTVPEEDLIQLRSAVAQRVMGWTASTIPWAYGESTRCWHNADNAALLTAHAWQPDRDERQCMDVLDHMLARGFDFTMSIEHGRAQVQFRRAARYHEAGEHADRRIALLIAALQACEADRE